MSITERNLVVFIVGFLLSMKIQEAFVSAKILKVAFLIDPVQEDIYGDVSLALKEIELMNLETQVEHSVFVVNTSEPSYQENKRQFCEFVASEPISVVVDFTYQRLEEALDLVQANNVPYLSVGRILSPFLEMFGEFLQQKGANDVALIFQNERDEQEALFHMIDGFSFRTMLLNAGDSVDFVARLKQLRPSPSYYAIFARGSSMNSIFERVNKAQLFERPQEWHFVFLDARDRVFKYKKQVEFATKFTLNAKSLCRSMQMKDAYCASGFTFQRAVLLEILRSLVDARESSDKWLEPEQVECNMSESAAASDPSSFDPWNHLKFSDFMTFAARAENDEFVSPPLTYLMNVSINFYSNAHEAATDLAVWQMGELRRINQTISPAKRFFRIGTTEAIPWSYYRRDARTNEIVLDATGNPIWEGYCIDFVETLAERLHFDYVLVPPTSGQFGERDPVTGRWDGIVGDLVSGETDFAVTALRMYSEREEVIDYIAPYFEQTGISIVIRKPVRQTSLFKFMTVLRLEVWLSIIAALVTTAFMIWLMDKYSPYSSRNNKLAYPYPCREFTLRESFWFALTSFTPQGGGEAPKAISGRILVAAYWLFVVLMLATFTANLAAFLTVERMQTPVQSLEQLARQSRINYTVVADSDTHKYFINMKFAEDTLYRMWKELALNATSDFHRYRVWDYPIKEQYGQILLAINGSEPVRDAEEGFRKVNEHENADFAFIHDSSEIKYAVTRNCNFTEVGEVFSEQPYAIAVQQGSHLADEFTFTILELQKDRYFEELKAKYWNYSLLKDCSSSEDQEGITLESLGGVFIATLFGLGLAMLTLGAEVLYYRRKQVALRPLGSVTKVVPIKEALPMPRKNAWFAGKTRREEPKPPPYIEAATFRGRKMPLSITLGGTEFRPRRTNITPEVLGGVEASHFKDDNLPAKPSELPPYME